MTDKTLTRRSILKYLSAATLLSGAITAASVAQAQRVDKKGKQPATDLWTTRKCHGNKCSLNNV